MTRLGPGPKAGGLALVIAVWMIPLGLAAAGLLEAVTQARSWSAAETTTIEIPSGVPRDREQALARALEALPGVGGVRLLTPEEVRALLAPWLDSSADLPDLPGVILLHRDSGSPDSGLPDSGSHLVAPDIAGTVGAALPEAVVSDDPRRAARLAALGQRLTGGAMLVAALTGAAAFLAIAIAVSRACAACGTVIEAAHFAGAGGWTIAGAVARRFVWTGFLGATGGLLVLAPGPAAFALSYAPLRALAALPAAVALIVGLVALAAVALRLRRLP